MKQEVSDYELEKVKNKIDENKIYGEMNNLTMGIILFICKIWTIGA